MNAVPPSPHMRNSHRPTPKKFIKSSVPESEDVENHPVEDTGKIAIQTTHAVEKPVGLRNSDSMRNSIAEVVPQTDKIPLETISSIPAVKLEPSPLKVEVVAKTAKPPAHTSGWRGGLKQTTIRFAATPKQPNTPIVPYVDTDSPVSAMDGAQAVAATPAPHRDARRQMAGRTPKRNARMQPDSEEGESESGGSGCERDALEDSGGREEDFSMHSVPVSTHASPFLFCGDAPSPGVSIVYPECDSGASAPVSRAESPLTPAPAPTEVTPAVNEELVGGCAAAEADVAELDGIIMAAPLPANFGVEEPRLSAENETETEFTVDATTEQGAAPVAAPANSFGNDILDSVFAPSVKASRKTIGKPDGSVQEDAQPLPPAPLSAVVNEICNKSLTDLMLKAKAPCRGTSDAVGASFPNTLNGTGTNTTGNSVSRALHPHRRPMSSVPAGIFTGISSSQPQLRPVCEDATAPTEPSDSAETDPSEASVPTVTPATIAVSRPSPEECAITNHRDLLAFKFAHQDVAPAPYHPISKGDAVACPQSPEPSSITDRIDLTSTIAKEPCSHRADPITNTPPQACRPVRPLARRAASQAPASAMMSVACGASASESESESRCSSAPSNSTAEASQFVYDLTTANRFEMDAESVSEESAGDCSADFTDTTVDADETVLSDEPGLEAVLGSEQIPRRHATQTKGHQDVVSELMDCSQMLDDETEGFAMNNTTITMNDEEEMVDCEDAPMLVVGPRRGSTDGATEGPSAMKELLLVSSRLGEATTIKLTFGNDRAHKSDLVIRSKAVIMRFDPYHRDGAGVDVDARACGFCGSEVTGTDFQVSPYELTIRRGEVGSMYVTFVPKQSYGVYSGALKLSSSRKSFVFLLRGECKKPAIAPSSGVAIMTNSVGSSFTSDEYMPNDPSDDSTGPSEEEDSDCENSILETVMSPAPAAVVVPISSGSKPMTVRTIATTVTAGLPPKSPNLAALQAMSGRKLPVASTPRQPQRQFLVSGSAISSRSNTDSLIRSALLSPEPASPVSACSLSSISPVAHEQTARDPALASKQDWLQQWLAQQRQTDEKPPLSTGGKSTASLVSFRSALRVAANNADSPQVTKYNQQPRSQVHSQARSYPTSANRQLDTPYSISNSLTHCDDVVSRNYCRDDDSSDDGEVALSLLQLCRPSAGTARNLSASLASPAPSISSGTAAAAMMKLMQASTTELSPAPNNNQSLNINQSSYQNITAMTDHSISTVLSCSDGSEDAEPESQLSQLMESSRGHASTAANVTMATTNTSMMSGYMAGRSGVQTLSSTVDSSPAAGAFSEHSMQLSAKVNAVKQMMSRLAGNAISETLSSGIYFRESTIDFGSDIEVGSVSRRKIELCNNNNREVTVHVKDPALPFVILHTSFSLKPRSFVRMPVRFIPTSSKTYSCLLEVTVVGADTNTNLGPIIVELTGSGTE